MVQNFINKLNDYCNTERFFHESNYIKEIYQIKYLLIIKIFQAKGGGYESEESYPNCRLTFADIQNIHVMRESLRKIKELCYPNAPASQFLQRLDDAHWLEYTRVRIDWTNQR